MKNFLLFIITFSILGLQAQITYQSSEYANASEIFINSQSTTNLSSFDFSITGTNHTWDYASLTEDSENDNAYLSPSQTGYQFGYIGWCVLNGGNAISCASNWSNYVDLARKEFDSINLFVVELKNGITHFQKTNDALVSTIVGVTFRDTSGQDYPLAVEYYNLDTLYTFPINYLDTHHSIGGWKIDLTNFGFPVKYSNNFDRSYKVEGYGQLITPYQTFTDVLKIREVVKRRDTIDAGFFPVPTSFTTVTYKWFANGYGQPVMEATGLLNNGNENMTNVSYFKHVTSANIFENQLNKVSIYPNPAQEFISVDNIPFQFNYQLLDYTGKLVENNISKNGKIDISSLDKGTYFLRIQNKTFNFIKL